MEVKKDESFYKMEQYLKEIELNIFKKYKSEEFVLPFLEMNEYQILQRFNKENFEKSKKDSQVLINEELENLLKEEKINIDTFKEYEMIYQEYMKNIKAKIEMIENSPYFSQLNLNSDFKSYLIFKRLYNFKVQDQNDYFLDNLAIALFISELVKVIEQEKRLYKKTGKYRKELGLLQIKKILFSNPLLEISSLDNLNEEDKTLFLTLLGNDPKIYFEAKMTDKLEIKKQKLKNYKLFQLKKQQLAKKIIDMIFKIIYSKQDTISKEEVIIAKQYLNAVKIYMYDYTYKDPYDSKCMSYDELIDKKFNSIEKTLPKERVKIWKI